MIGGIVRYNIVADNKAGFGGTPRRAADHRQLFWLNRSGRGIYNE